MFRNRREYDDDSYRSDFFLGEMEEKSRSHAHSRPSSPEEVKPSEKSKKKAEKPAENVDETVVSKPKNSEKKAEPCKKAPYSPKELFLSLQKSLWEKKKAAQAKRKPLEEKKAEEKKPLSENKEEAPFSPEENKSADAPSPKKPMPVKRKAKKFLPPRSLQQENINAPKEQKNPKKEKDPTLLKKENEVKNSLDGMYGVSEKAEPGAKKPLSGKDIARYSVLFLCIFGFLTAAYFVFGKLFDYYRSYVVYSGLQEMVGTKDRFAEEYLKKASSTLKILTPADILAGKTSDDESVSSTFSEEQETLVNKIAQLKKINPDTAGWITIDGTVVNYPVVWSATKNYYLRRDFYGKKLSGGTIYIDERNSPNITQNRNTVIYGHNMTDGSMFASIHDFASPTVFYGATIQIATSEGIFIYKPFSVHESNAFDNYFETDFVSDEDFLDFCEQMAFISIFETNTQFSRDSQIITLSTCMDNQSESEQRFAVHAILTKVIR